MENAGLSLAPLFFAHRTFISISSPSNPIAIPSGDNAQQNRRFAVRNRSNRKDTLCRRKRRIITPRLLNTMSLRPITTEKLPSIMKTAITKQRLTTRM
jgi:hypothetical protein